MIAWAGAIVLGLFLGLGGEPPELNELVPGVRVAPGVVEFAGTVCADPSHPETPIVYLEMLVTGPDSREHESLVVTSVAPSAIHAGLLAAGFEPGHPVREEIGERIGATGDRVRVEVSLVGPDGAGPFTPLSDWGVRIRDEGDESPAQRLSDADDWALVFAGSVLKAGGYAADRTGTIVGLTGFGTEVVSPTWTLSPWLSVDEPEWIVDADRVPPFGTEVMVRIVGAGGAGDGPSVGDDRDAPGPGSE